MANDNMMKWQKDFETFFHIYNTFIFEGYIDDDQPFDDGGQTGYCKLPEYFVKTCGRESGEKFKRVIVYDPTEADDRRFEICDEDGVPVPVEKNGRTRLEKNFEGSLMSQHFSSILAADDSSILIDHRSAGATLDFSRIHYALTERTRMGADYDGEYYNLLANSETEPTGYMFVIKMTSRLLSHGAQNGLSNDELMMFRQLLNMAQSIDGYCDDPHGRHKLVILANDVKDLPSWFADEAANPFVKIINISHPSEENKLAFFKEMREDPGCFGEEFLKKYGEADAAAKAKNANATRNKVEKKFLAYTNDFSMKMLRRYKEYVKSEQVTDPEKIGYSITSFMIGDLTNPWDDDKRIQEMLNIKTTVGQKIKGQDYALETAQNIITRAALGLDRAENPNAPRVVLFLAGPTGTGKTELCKQLAEAVFGSEDRIVRFDMSEYGQEESDQKLFGAPPGYVGYEEGGKLTNAIKKEPFSLVLFDEIEKAHGSILDKFLQIVGDGRLTDGKGETVRFTDSIIVITSNAGVTKKQTTLGPDDILSNMGGETEPEQVNIASVIKMEEDGLTPDEIYAKVRECLRYNVKFYFNCCLGRPELYGRLEDSMVYYNYIGQNSVEPISWSKMSDVIKSAKEALLVSDVIVPDEVKDAIIKYCCSASVRELGARGIIKATGKLFTGSLARDMAAYVRRENGKSKEDLAGATITCSCEGEVKSADDIKWRVV